MKLAERLLKERPMEVWEEYCGFLALDVDRYMAIQHRLLKEQLALWCDCALGRHFLNGTAPEDFDRLRDIMPLTTYDDYADILLQRRGDVLPLPPVTWIETTWEGGRHPVKCAPYTRGMVDTFSHNGITTMLLGSATGWGEFSVGEKILSGLAPMPYLTGLIGLILDEDYGFDMMPPRTTLDTMSFSERSKYGFKQALSHGMDYFLSMGSVAYYLSLNLSAVAGGGKKKKKSGSHSLSMPTLFRLMKAKMAADKENRDVLPKDIFKPKAFICAGTDNACYKDDLEKMWGIRPIELFAGTEAGMVGCESWNRKDLYFFPDTAFYEFLPEAYIRTKEKFPPTLTMAEVRPGEKYELIVTVFRGGAFVRYRTGDIYRCTGIGSAEDHSKLPRFRYIDRHPDIIDIAGFTRITKNSVEDVLRLSALPIHEWAAAKEMDAETGHPYFHMYVEIDAEALMDRAVTIDVLKKHLEIYFNYLDSDYDSLKKILGMELLRIDILRSGTFERFRKRTGSDIERINPPREKLAALTRLQTEEDPVEDLTVRGVK
ncbi:MAG: GH3 auxin-responsive promoter family protein [Clostridia bacterium]|nr:GH3 auxin-responsive promoter family protein [Clostridia bacterium]